MGRFKKEVTVHRNQKKYPINFDLRTEEAHFATASQGKRCPSYPASLNRLQPGHSPQITTVHAWALLSTSTNPCTSKTCVNQMSNLLGYIALIAIDMYPENRYMICLTSRMAYGDSGITKIICCSKKPGHWLAVV